jgi:predicted amidophosphoribosyltransferase
VPRVALARTFLREAEVALVDDVATTGATLRDAAMTLRRIGVSVRGALVVAYAPRLR